MYIYYCKTKHLLTLTVFIQCVILNVNPLYARAPVVQKLVSGLTLAGKDQLDYYAPDNLIGMGGIL